MQSKEKEESKAEMFWTRAEKREGTHEKKCGEDEASKGKK